MSTAIVTTGSARPLLDQAISTYVKGRAVKTQTAYRERLARFLAWYDQQPPAPFLDHLRGYIDFLTDEGLSPRSIQAHLNTVKGMLKIVAALEPSFAAALPSLDLVKAPAVRGEVQGDRLDRKQRDRLINLPGVETHKGRRDTAILGLLADCGLRRAEVISLNWSHIAEIDGHKVVKNLQGKHGRVRTVKLPIPLWRLIVRWAELAGIDTSPDAAVFVAVRKGDTIQHGQRLSTQAIGFLVKEYGDTLKTGDFTVPDISPHDLRRTAASLARKGGASIEQVQVMLGHASPQTTSAYIGEALDLDDFATDYSASKYPDPGVR